MPFDVYDYIPSPDVAAHCKKLNVIFKPQEQAVLVYLSQKPLEERLSAYEQLAELHKGYPFSRKGFFGEREVELSECLQKTIAYERQSAELFMAAGADVLFRPCCKECRKSIRNYGYRLNYFSEYEGGLYRSFEEALKELQSLYGEEKHKDLNAYRIDRLEIGDRYAVSGDARILLDGTLIDAHTVSERDDKMSESGLWQMIYVYLPTPFQRGDIIAITERGRQSLAVFDGSYDDEHPERRAYRDAFSDTSDMTAHILFCDDEGQIGCDAIFPNTNLCRFQGELPDECLMLQCMSDALKNGTDLWDYDATVNILRHIYAIQSQTSGGYRLDERQRKLLQQLAEKK